MIVNDAAEFLCALHDGLQHGMRWNNFDSVDAADDPLILCCVQQSNELREVADLGAEFVNAPEDLVEDPHVIERLVFLHPLVVVKQALGHQVQVELCCCGLYPLPRHRARFVREKLDVHGRSRLDQRSPGVLPGVPVDLTQFGYIGLKAELQDLVWIGEHGYLGLAKNALNPP